jgi:dCMP deaminase
VIVNCQSFCEHGNQCRHEAGHAALVHLHTGCGCVGSAQFRRPDWDQYFMAQARLAATRGSCDRRQVGAVLVVDNRSVATGYNGAPSGYDNCLDVGHQMVEFKDGISSCVRTLHAEMNAIIQCAVTGISTRGATLYCTASPCLDCLKALIGAQVKAIVYDTPYTGGRLYGASDLQALVAKSGISWRRIGEPVDAPRKPDEFHVTERALYRNEDKTTTVVTTSHHTPCPGNCGGWCRPIKVTDRITPRD